jgi:Domain of unknown function (DUF1905)
MADNTYSFQAAVWEHDGSSAWHFISLPEADTDDIDERFGHRAAGFGSLRVQVTIGTTAWTTSIFPDTKRGTFVLPVKKAVRIAEGLRDGTVAHVELEVL